MSIDGGRIERGAEGVPAGRFFVAGLLAFLLCVSAASGLRAAEGPAVPEEGSDARGEEVGLPLFRHWGPKEHGGGVQSWAVVQDERGVLYVANNDGVLEFDGVRWRLIQTVRKTIVRSLAVDGAGRVWVGGRGEIGYLAPGEGGRTVFVSLNDRFGDEGRDLSDVFGTFVTPEGIYFQTRERLLLLGKDGVRSWKPQDSFHRAFYARGRLFVRDLGSGLLELREGRLEPIPGGGLFAGERVGAVLPLDSGGGMPTSSPEGAFLVVTRTRGLFRFDGAGVAPFPTEADEVLRRSQLSHAVWLNDGTLALSSVQGGLLRIDRRGRLLPTLDTANGFPTDAVYGLSTDGGSGLWLATGNGVSHVEWPAPLSLFDQRTGLRGSVIAIHRHAGLLHVGSDQGVQLLDASSGSPARFRPVRGLSAQCWSFLSFGERLLVANLRGVFEIRGGEASLVRPSSFPSMYLHRSRRDPARVFVGLNDGLASVRVGGAGSAAFTDEGKVAGIDEEVRTIAEAEDGRLWLGTVAHGLLRVSFDGAGPGSGAAPRVERFGPEEGLPAWVGNDVYIVEGRPTFATSRGLFRFLEGEGRFEPDPAYAGLFPGGPRVMAWLKEDQEGRIWTDTTDQMSGLHETGAVVRGEGGTRLFEKTPFLRFSDMVVWSILPEPDGVVWFGGPDGIVRYDPRVRKEYSQGLATLVRAVDKHSGGSALTKRGPDRDLGSVPELKFAENSLRFEYALPAYDRSDGTRYQVFLEGRDPEWSDWTSEAYRDYTDLREGSYRFRVRGRNVHGKVGAEGTFAFRILPPWYRTWWARSLQALAGAGLVALIALAYSRKLLRQKAVLEALVAKRTQQLREASLTDPLTGLRNRRFIAEVLQDDVAAFVSYKSHLLAAPGSDRRRGLQEDAVFGLFMFDIDHFKSVNDSYQHEGGDRVLKEFAAILRRAVRQDDVVIRLGGEEFLVVLKKTSPDYLQVFAARVLADIREHEFDVGNGVTIRKTCSVGCTSFPLYPSQPGLLTFDQCIQLADQGLYFAKEHGRDQAVLLGAGAARPSGEAEAQRTVSDLTFALEMGFVRRDGHAAAPTASSEP